jgi:hypothetical protein
MTGGEDALGGQGGSCSRKRRRSFFLGQGDNVDKGSRWFKRYSKVRARRRRREDADGK